MQDTVAGLPIDVAQDGVCPCGCVRNLRCAFWCEWAEQRAAPLPPGRLTRTSSSSSALINLAKRWRHLLRLLGRVDAKKSWVFICARKGTKRQKDSVTSASATRSDGDIEKANEDQATHIRVFFSFVRPALVCVGYWLRTNAERA